MLVNIDAGHGSETAGKRTPEGYREHWANVKVANYFAEAMSRCGVNFMKTGWNDVNAKDDPDVPLSTRQKQIKSARCDYSISFHFNACGDGKTYNSGEGIEVLISNKSAGDSKNLAQCVLKYLIMGTVQKNRGIKTQALAMCNCSTMGTKAAILIECGFMTNKREADLMQSDEFCKECAEETARGFCDYAKIPYVNPGAPVATTKFRVKVIVDDLKIRTEPSIITGKIVGAVNTNEVYTIVEERNNWGRLISGAGWIKISSSYVTRL